MNRHYIRDNEETPVYQPRIERRQRAAIIVIAVLLLVCGSLAAFKASAQTVPGTMNIAWVLPTTGCTMGVQPCDNKPLTGEHALTAIEVYISTSPITDSSSMQPTLTLSPSVTTTAHTMQVTNGQTLYARIKARNTSGLSVFSAQGSKPIALPITPGVPTNVTITLQIG